MVAAKLNKSKAKLKASQKKPLNKWLIVAGVVAVSIVGVLVVRFSSASVRYYYSGKTVVAISTTGASPVVSSRDGMVCVATRFSDNIPGVDGSFKIRIQKYLGNNKFQEVASSKKFSANGNRDFQCFNDNINKNIGYRAVFDPEGAANLHGNYTIWGYKHD